MKMNGGRYASYGNTLEALAQTFDPSSAATTTTTTHHHHHHQPPSAAQHVVDYGANNPCMQGYNPAVAAQPPPSVVDPAQAYLGGLATIEEQHHQQHHQQQHHNLLVSVSTSSSSGYHHNHHHHSHHSSQQQQQQQQRQHHHHQQQQQQQQQQHHDPIASLLGLAGGNGNGGSSSSSRGGRATTRQELSPVLDFDPYGRQQQQLAAAVSGQSRSTSPNLEDFLLLQSFSTDPLTLLQQQQQPASIAATTATSNLASTAAASAALPTVSSSSSNGQHHSNLAAAAGGISSSSSFQQEGGGVDDAWLDGLKVEVSALSLEPMTGREIVERIRGKMNDVISLYLPCVDFLVQCQQELRKGLAVATQSKRTHHRSNGSRYNRNQQQMTPHEFYMQYIDGLPRKFYGKNLAVMRRSDLLENAVQALQGLTRDSRNAERHGCEAVKSAFLGGMKDGESWGLRKWLSKHGNGLRICTDLECILQAVQKNLDRSARTTKQLSDLLRPVAKDTLRRLKSDVPASYQEHSTAHPYLPFFHRLESALRGMSTFDPEDDDVICIDDSDDDDDPVVVEPQPAPPSAPPVNKRKKKSTAKKQAPAAAAAQRAAVRNLKNAAKKKTGAGAAGSRKRKHKPQETVDLEAMTTTTPAPAPQAAAAAATGPPKKRPAHDTAQDQQQQQEQWQEQQQQEQWQEQQQVQQQQQQTAKPAPLAAPGAGGAAGDCSSSSGEEEEEDMIEVVAVKPTTQPQQQQQDWTCPCCSLPNSCTSQVCMACGTPYLSDMQFFPSFADMEGGAAAGGAVVEEGGCDGLDELEAATNLLQDSNNSGGRHHRQQQQKQPSNHTNNHTNHTTTAATALSPAAAAPTGGTVTTIVTWPLQIRNTTKNHQLANHLDVLASVFDQGQQTLVRPLSLCFGQSPADTFWDGERFAKALRVWTGILRQDAAAHFCQPEDEDALIRGGLLPYSHVIKHPLCFSDVCGALLQNGAASDDDDDENVPESVVPAGNDGRLPALGLSSWNMWRGIDLLQAVDLVLLNSLAYGKALSQGKTKHRSETNKLRKMLWNGIHEIVDGLGGSMSSAERRKVLTPTRRSDTSGFVVYKIQADSAK